MEREDDNKIGQNNDDKILKRNDTYRQKENKEKNKD
jgi:hypothetical protein